MFELVQYLNIPTKQLFLINTNISKRGTNICKRVKKKIYVCGTNQNKCPFLSHFPRNKRLCTNILYWGKEKVQVQPPTYGVSNYLDISRKNEQNVPQI